MTSLAPMPIRDAACIVLVDASAGEPRLLLGRRRATQVFLPNKWVFPGGRVDDADRHLARSIQMSGEREGEKHRIPFVIAAVRELYEEAGLAVTQLGADPGKISHLDIGGLESARQLLTPLARAITPPGRPRRFDTWFFLLSGHVASVKDPDGELLDLGWFTLAEAKLLDLPHITRLVVDDAADSLRRGPSARNGPFPFYFQGPESYERQLIDDDSPPQPP